MSEQKPLTEQQLDLNFIELGLRAGLPINEKTALRLLAEVRRLRAENERLRQAWQTVRDTEFAAEYMDGAEGWLADMRNFYLRSNPEMLEALAVLEGTEAPGSYYEARQVAPAEPVAPVE